MPSINIFRKSMQKLRTSSASKNPKVNGDTENGTFDEVKTSTNGTTTPVSIHTENPKYRPRESIEQDRKRKSMERQRKAVESAKRKSLAAQREESYIRKEPAELTALYKPLSMNQSKRRDYGERFKFKNLSIDGSYQEARKYHLHISNGTRRHGRQIHYFQSTNPHPAQVVGQNDLYRFQTAGVHCSRLAAN